MMLRLRVLASLYLLIGFGIVGSHAQAPYPNRTVQIVVPSSPGGVTDVLARMVGQAMSKAWGTPVVVVNRPGADEVIGLNSVAKSKNDGYTLLVSNDAAFTAGPHLHSQKLYDTLKDFTPILFLGQITPVLCVPASLPVHSVSEFIAYAKANAGNMNYASFGVGTYAHLSMEEFNKRTGTNILHVPYKGSTPATVALLRGEVSAMIVNINVIAQHVRAGTVRIIAAAGPSRSTFRPDLPTIAESGVPGFATGAWWGLFGPADLPPAVVDKIRRDVAAYLRTPEAVKFFEINTMEPAQKTPEQFAKLIRDDFEHWGSLIKAVGVTHD
jgi:tripartite-type tricarboxylate transporter receptor subunit TctC